MKLNKQGHIPAGKVCQYTKKCKSANSNCPTRGKTKQTPHDCGFVKLIMISRPRPETAPDVQETTIKRVLVSFEEAVQQKIAERVKPQVFLY